MNKRHLHIFLILLLLTSCKKENLGDCFKPTGKNKIVNRAVEPFSKIKMADGINVSISQGSQTSLQVEGGKNLLDNVITEVRDGTLLIENRNKCNWVRSFKKEINVHISLTSLDEIEYSGSGNIQFLNTLQVDQFIINMYQASGEVNLKLNSNYIELKIHTGPGKMSASGNSGDLVLYNNGPGFIDSQGLVTRSAIAINNNTGKVYVNALDELKAEIFGSGNIYYFGNPTVDFTRNGNGVLIKK